MYPGGGGWESSGESLNLFSVCSRIDLLSPERIKRPFGPNIHPSLNALPFSPCKTRYLPNWVTPTQLDEEGYRLLWMESLPLLYFNALESRLPIVMEGIRGSWLKSIFDDQLRLPAVETTISWKYSKVCFGVLWPTEL